MVLCSGLISSRHRRSIPKVSVNRRGSWGQLLAMVQSMPQTAIEVDGDILTEAPNLGFAIRAAMAIHWALAVVS